MTYLRDLENSLHTLSMLEILTSTLPRNYIVSMLEKLPDQRHSTQIASPIHVCCHAHKHIHN